MILPHDLKVAILQYCLSPDRAKGITEDFDALADLGEQHGWSELRKAIEEFIVGALSDLVNPRPMDRTQPPPGWTPGPHGIAGRGEETGEVSGAWESYLADQGPLTTENAVLRGLLRRAFDHYDMCAERDLDGFQEWLSDATDFLRQHQEGYEDENGTATSAALPKSTDVLTRLTALSKDGYAGVKVQDGKWVALYHFELSNGAAWMDVQSDEFDNPLDALDDLDAQIKKATTEGTE
jgi:hypothetical protein